MRESTAGYSLQQKLRFHTQFSCSMIYFTRELCLEIVTVHRQIFCRLIKMKRLLAGHSLKEIIKQKFQVEIWRLWNKCSIMKTQGVRNILICMNIKSLFKKIYIFNPIIIFCNPELLTTFLSKLILEWWYCMRWLFINASYNNNNNNCKSNLYICY